MVFIPKYRKKSIDGQLRAYLGDVFRQLARHRESQVEEGHLLVSISPKYSVSQVIGYIKGKSAIQIAREFADRGRNFTGQHFWARGYFVSTVGRDEGVIRHTSSSRSERISDSTSCRWSRGATFRWRK